VRPVIAPVDVAILGELGGDGALRTALGALAPDGSPWARRAAGVELAGATLAVMIDDVPSLRPLAATATATGWTLAAPLAGDPVYLVAQPQGWAARRGWSRAGPTAITSGHPALPRRTMPRGAAARRARHSEECPAVRAMS
jgi:hypothetical protein